MAIALEFINVVVPIARIREVYPGGWEQCVQDYAQRIGQRAWYDQYLFRDGALHPGDARQLVEGWRILGFEVTQTHRGRVNWKDVCVIDSRHGGPTAPCPWLALENSGRVAYLAQTPPGPLAWRGRPSPGSRHSPVPVQAGSAAYFPQR